MEWLTVNILSSCVNLISSWFFYSISRSRFAYCF